MAVNKFRELEINTDSELCFNWPSVNFPPFCKGEWECLVLYGAFALR